MWERDLAINKRPNCSDGRAHDQSEATMIDWLAWLIRSGVAVWNKHHSGRLARRSQEGAVREWSQAAEQLGMQRLQLFQTLTEAFDLVSAGLQVESGLVPDFDILKLLVAEPLPQFAFNNNLGVT
jgi:hypothetical protein